MRGRLGQVSSERGKAGLLSVKEARLVAGGWQKGLALPVRAVGGGAWLVGLE